VAIEKLAGRALKQRVLELLRSSDFDPALVKLSSLPPRRVINPLFSFLYNRDAEVRWRAITAMGGVVARLADSNMESARVIMRRLMWNLNDESGGVGWGSPEAMGEIMASHKGLAEEYTNVLISYTREDGNYLEFEPLQCGLLWGIGRLLQVRPHLIRDRGCHLTPYLESNDATVRGHAAWSIGLLETEDARAGLQRLTEDEAELEIYLDRNIITCLVRDLAEEALKRLRRPI
jgi:HEAT repeat protein